MINLKTMWRRGRGLFLHSLQRSNSFSKPPPEVDISEEHHSLNPDFSYDKKLQSFLYGRRLLDTELQEFSESILTEHINNGYIMSEAVLTKEKGRLKCKRCSNTDSNQFAFYQCGRCGKNCVYCRRCLTMGVVKECSRLFTWCGPPLPLRPLSTVTVHWDGRLTDRQQQAADALLEAVKERENFLVWAVTGAGKTELIYPALHYTVQNGLRVAVVSPRIDVVIELSRRLVNVFSDVKVNVLYGDSPEKFERAPITLATTHQLLRFYHYFDTVFVDEVDAFPFHNNDMLHYALEKSSKPDASFNYLTATPSNQMQREYEKGELKGIKISRRFHGFPLLEPKFQWIGNWARCVSRGKVPTRLIRWLESQKASGRQAFLFVPSIEVLDQLTPLLKTLHPHIDAVHAEDPERYAKVRAFREGQIPILVTTTILERGVTIPFLDVAILGADDPIFDEKALVQISGRVGRDARDPKGELIFFHYGVTHQMIKAQQHIRKMNKEV